MLTRVLAAAVFVIVTSSSSSDAQYMYLDANGDGLRTAADFLNPAGVGTTVDVYLDPVHNRDGSPATCNTGDGALGLINSYLVNLSASGGTVAYSDPVNRRPDFAVVVTPFESSETEMTMGFASGTYIEASAAIRIMSVTITQVSGCPHVSISPLSSLSTDPTSFGTTCSGLDFDQTYKLGLDWVDADGVGSGIIDDFNPPLIIAPAAVNGQELIPISVTAIATDADGNLLILSQTNNAPFLSGPTSSGPSANPSLTVSGTPSLTQSGSYTINWRVESGACVATTATTNLLIANNDQATANAFTTGGNGTTSLSAGKPYTCVQIEPVDGSYLISDVVLSSITMSYTGGIVSSITADASKTTIDGDKNGNGVSEVTACFKKSDLRLLFSGLPAGRNTVTVDIRGELITARVFHATLTMVVKSTGGALAMSISPNPLNPKATLFFMTSKAGAIRVQMFDPQGRLVKTVAEERSVEAGYHDFSIDGTSTSGMKLASGVYFVKVWSQYDGQEVKSMTILK